MATVYVNMKPGKGSKSAKAEVLTTSTAHAETTAVTLTSAGVITLFSTAAHYVSVGATPNAETDAGRQLLFPNFPLCLEGIPDGMKVSAVALA